MGAVILPLYTKIPFPSTTFCKQFEKPKPNSPPACATNYSAKPTNKFHICMAKQQQQQVELVRGQKLMEFPHLLPPHKQLMTDLISAVDDRLRSQLLPSSATVPPDVEYYHNQTASSQGTLSINRGLDSSQIDFILASWLHFALPSGGAMNITNLQGYLKPSTDAPHFQFELVQCSPTFFIFFLDFTPRKDIVLNPDYLKTFWGDKQLDDFRKRLEVQVPEARPYFSSSLYFRNVISPTGIMVGIDCGESGGTKRAEQIIGECISPIAKEMMEIWMDSCACGGNHSVEESKRGELEERDRMIKSHAVAMDLSSSMPLQFGQEVADRVLRVIKSTFRV